MPYEDQFFRYPTMKGIAIELPFVKFKYVKVDWGEPEKSKSAKSIDVTIPSKTNPPAALSRVIISREAEVTTLGMDTMISYASVIHELTYGRIETARDSKQAASYPAVLASSYSLDIIV
ncbi:MAG: hypothetical protein ACLQDF_06770 [Desulfomonilia bacterium]